ncbi:MAG: outer membrane protein assembly factor BamE [Holosporales bacterium]|jgi:outer membrane protein assembly factor BamE (lipoprotein component of BamABCDE complex)|nr:outer membrane protein assembly factor BamE [Holosporales bacterium]
MNGLIRIVFVFLLMFVSGCKPVISTSGNLCEADDLNNLKIGVHGVNDVYEILGTPSFKLDGNRVLYIGRRLRSISFFDPKVTEEKAVLVTFNQRGILSDWQIVELDHQKIVFDKAITPVRDTGRTHADHILDNLQKPGRRK